MLRFAITSATLFASAIAGPVDGAQFARRQASNLTVDLDYGLYQGYRNETTGLNVWKGYFAQSLVLEI